MVNFKYTRNMFKIGQMAFCSYKDITKNNVDVINLHSYDQENYAKNDKWVLVDNQYTFVHDLSKDKDDILAMLSKTYRYQIRRCEKDGLEYKVIHSIDESVIRDFENVYNSMFECKQMSNRFNSSLVKAGLREGSIIITVAKAVSDTDCKVYHAYLVDGQSAMMMYSASLIWGNKDKEKTALIGRLNKTLHWYDMCMFKEEGYIKYEWGGIKNPDDMNGIDNFKAGFGGELCRFHNYTIGTDLLGKLYIVLLKIKGMK